MITVLEYFQDRNFINSYLLPLANNNIRRLLEIVCCSFQAYYFFYDRYNNNRYLPSLKSIKQRFLYAQMLKNCDYYIPNREDGKGQCILNLFENNRAAKDNNQLIRIRILQFLNSMIDEIPISIICERIQSVFRYDAPEIWHVLKVFSVFELICFRFDADVAGIETKEFFNTFSLEKIKSKKIYVSVTTSGQLHLRLIKDINYMEIMKYSTYVSEKYQKRIQSEEENRTLEQRKNSTLLFVKYLQEEQKLEQTSAILDLEEYNGKYRSLLDCAYGDIESDYNDLLKNTRKR
jgi:hypothetical protein